MQELNAVVKLTAQKRYILYAIWKHNNAMLFEVYSVYSLFSDSPLGMHLSHQQLVKGYIRAESCVAIYTYVEGKLIPYNSPTELNVNVAVTWLSLNGIVYTYNHQI
jgi:hypothetical protein